MTEYWVLVKSRAANRFNRAIPTKKGSSLSLIRKVVSTLPTRNSYKIVTKTQLQGILKGKIKRIKRKK